MHNPPNTHNTGVTENDEHTDLENALEELKGNYHRLLFGDHTDDNPKVPSEPFSTNKRLMIKATQMLYSTFKIIKAMSLTEQKQKDAMDKITKYVEKNSEMDAKTFDALRKEITQLLQNAFKAYKEDKSNTASLEPNTLKHLNEKKYLKVVLKPEASYNLNVIYDKTLVMDDCTITNFMHKKRTDDGSINRIKVKSESKQQWKDFAYGQSTNHKAQKYIGNTFRFDVDGHRYFSHSHPYSDRVSDKTARNNRILLFVGFLLPPLLIFIIPIIFLRSPSKNTQETVNRNMDLLHKGIKDNIERDLKIAGVGNPAHKANETYHVTINYTSPNFLTKFAPDNEIDWWNAQKNHWKKSSYDYCLLNIPMNMAGGITWPTVKSHNDEALGKMIFHHFGEPLGLQKALPLTKTMTQLTSELLEELNKTALLSAETVTELTDQSLGELNQILKSKKDHLTLLNSSSNNHDISEIYNYNKDDRIEKTEKSISHLEKIIQKHEIINNIKPLYDAFTDLPIKNLPTALVKFSKWMESKQGTIIAVDGHCKSGKDRAGVAAINIVHQLSTSNEQDKTLVDTLKRANFFPFIAAESSGFHKGVNKMLKNIDNTSSYSAQAKIAFGLILTGIATSVVFAIVAFALPATGLAALVGLSALVIPFAPVIFGALAGITLIGGIMGLMLKSSISASSNEPFSEDTQTLACLADGVKLPIDFGRNDLQVASQQKQQGVGSDAFAENNTAPNENDTVTNQYVDAQEIDDNRDQERQGPNSP